MIFFIIIIKGVIGNCKELGNWKNPILFNTNKVLNSNYYVLKLNLNLNLKLNSKLIEFKFVYFDVTNNSIIRWEEGENRIVTENNINNNNEILINKFNF